MRAIRDRIVCIFDLRALVPIGNRGLDSVVFFTDITSPSDAAGACFAGGVNSFTLRRMNRKRITSVNPESRIVIGIEWFRRRLVRSSGLNVDDVIGIVRPLNSLLHGRLHE